MRIFAALAALVLLAGCSSSGGTRHTRSATLPSAPSTSTAPSTTTAPSTPASTPTSPGSGFRASTGPALQHLVIVMEENHSYSDIAGNSSAPYLNELMAQGASLTDFFAITHPSQPNYVALFSGSTHGLTDDSCPHTFNAANLGSELRAAHRSFRGYSEGLPNAGYQGCSSGSYARKHVPWTDFPDLPGSVNQPLSALPSDYALLPTVSFVIPDLDHDMHDGTIAQGDTWLRAHLGGYVTWARTHDSALIVTWDEDDHSENNQIPTVVVGAHVRTMHYAQHADHYSMLRTLEWLFGLPALGASANRTPITGIWTS
jgi:Phosphoesterase family.